MRHKMLFAIPVMIAGVLISTSCYARPFGPLGTPSQRSFEIAIQPRFISCTLSSGEEFGLEDKDIVRFVLTPAPNIPGARLEYHLRGLGTTTSVPRGTPRDKACEKIDILKKVLSESRDSKVRVVATITASRGGVYGDGSVEIYEVMDIDFAGIYSFKNHAFGMFLTDDPRLD